MLGEVGVWVNIRIKLLIHNDDGWCSLQKLYIRVEDPKPLVLPNLIVAVGICLFAPILEEKLFLKES